MIGGFHSLDIKLEPSADGILNTITKHHNHFLFHNARSAIFHMLKSVNSSKTIWIPAYICSSILEPIKKAKFNIKFFPIDDNLSPNTVFLNNNIKKNDFVLAVNYFGTKPSQTFYDFVKSKTDVFFIEDRAQDISKDNFWGDFIVYSFRKHFGIADGAVLIDLNKKIRKNPKYEFYTNANFIESSFLRYEDEQKQNNKIWYKKYKEIEQKHSVSKKPFSKLSKEILNSISYEKTVKIKIDNYKYLSNNIKENAKVKKLKIQNLVFIPNGFPLVAKESKELSNYLASNNIFAPRYWQDIVADKNIFKFEHEISSSNITLPCDHRYNKKDMDFIIKILETF
jgi:hypothetical protein